MDLKIAGLRVLVTAGASGIGLATARAFAAEGARVLICDVDREARSQAVAASDRGSRAGRVRRRCTVAAVAVVRPRRRTNSAASMRSSTTPASPGPTAAVRRRRARRLGAHARRQPDRANSCARSGRSRCSRRARNREHRQSLLGGGSLRLSDAHALRGDEMGRDRVHEIACRSSSGRFGIRVNAICPGIGRRARASTPYSRTGQHARGITPEAAREEALARVSLRRLVSADDIANAIVFLASPVGPTSPAAGRWTAYTRRSRYEPCQSNCSSRRPGFTGL